MDIVERFYSNLKRLQGTTNNNGQITEDTFIQAMNMTRLTKKDMLVIMEELKKRGVRLELVKRKPIRFF